MKQKNLIMLGVAIGCGLVAAIAVAKLTAGGGKPADTMQLLVAKKDIPTDTTFTEKNMPELIGWAEFPKSLAPPDPILDLEMIKGKAPARTLKLGNVLTVSDVGKSTRIEIPSGFKLFSLSITGPDALVGFAKPGARVDILYVDRQNGKSRTAIVLWDMLVLAIDQHHRTDEKLASLGQVQSVSLACTDNQILLLAGLEKRGGHMKLALREGPMTDKEKEKEKRGIEWVEDVTDVGPLTSTPAPPMAVALPEKKMESKIVCRKTVPLNTLINSGNVQEFFDVEQVEKVADGVVTKLDDLKGKFIIEEVRAGQTIYKSLTGDKALEIVKKPDLPPPPKVEVKIEPKVEPKVVEKPNFPRHTQTLVKDGVVTKIIYMEVAPNKWLSFASEQAADDYRPDGDSKKDEKKPGAPASK